MTDEQVLGGREARFVHLQVVADLPVRLDDLADARRGGLVALVDRRGRDEALDVELVRVRQEPDHRLRIVRLVLDVREDEDARPGRRGIGDLRTRLCGRGEQRGRENHRSGKSSSHGRWPPSPAASSGADDRRSRAGTPRATGSRSGPRGECPRRRRGRDRRSTSSDAPASDAPVRAGGGSTAVKSPFSPWSAATSLSITYGQTFASRGENLKRIAPPSITPLAGMRPSNIMVA